jgi:hypothetical protein
VKARSAGRSHGAFAAVKAHIAQRCDAGTKTKGLASLPGPCHLFIFGRREWTRTTDLCHVKAAL